MTLEALSLAFGDGRLETDVSVKSLLKPAIEQAKHHLLSAAIHREIVSRFKSHKDGAVATPFRLACMEAANWIVHNRLPAAVRPTDDPEVDGEKYGTAVREVFREWPLDRIAEALGIAGPASNSTVSQFIGFDRLISTIDAIVQFVREHRDIPSHGTDDRRLLELDQDLCALCRATLVPMPQVTYGGSYGTEFLSFCRLPVSRSTQTLHLFCDSG
jgi:hypothetical protein